MQQNMTGQNIIITEPSSNLRALGRNALAGKWKMAIIAVIIYELCIQIPPVILNALFGTKADIYSGQGGVSVDLYSSIYNSMPSYSPLGGIYVLLVTGAFTLGITIFFLAVFRRQNVDTVDVFLGFEKFGKALGLMLYQGLFIFLWMLLFFIPGIIAAIRYSQAFYILADDPNKSIKQCMNESKIMMKGNKAKYFCLSLSFIGWMILSGLPAAVLDGIVNVTYAPAFIQALVTIIGSLFVVPVTVYMYSTLTGFYEILAGHLIKETEPAPVNTEAVSEILAPSEEPEAPNDEETNIENNNDENEFIPKEV